jgi:nucleoside-diphosphate-sugar epimerase
MGGPSFRGIRKEMRILFTGSSGWLGQTLVPRLSGQGHQVIGLDPIPSDHTQIVGSVTDRELVHLAIREFGVDSIIQFVGSSSRASDYFRRPKGARGIFFII